MARRSSARIRNRDSSTPKRVSLSHDAPTRTPRTAPVKMQTLHEYDEMPGAFPGSSSPQEQHRIASTNAVPSSFNNSTPKHATPIKPAAEEMHPQHHQQSTAKALEEARWLGFSNMAPKTEPPKQTSRIAVLQGTPTRAPRPEKETEAPRFKFSFGREQSLELSPEAKKLMSEKREEALRIREQMIAEGEGLKHAVDPKGRKIATPKGKKTRFSEVHLEQFKKMDSIAGHASSFRADPGRPKLTNTTPTKLQTGTPSSKLTTGELPKSLKRSPSKAGLSEDLRATGTPRSGSTTTLGQIFRTLPQSSSSSLHDQNSQESSPTKRAKMAGNDDVSTGRSATRIFGDKLPTTPRPSKTPIKHDSLGLSKVTTPTQASLARVSSVKSVRSTKIPAPALPTPSVKELQIEQLAASPKVSTPLLARSPSKASLFSKANAEQSQEMMSPLLLRTPSKPSHAPRSAQAEMQEGEKVEKPAPLLSRSPSKPPRTKRPLEAESRLEQEAEKAPLLSRSPLKMSVDQVRDFRGNEEVQQPSSIGFLARSPLKFSISKEDPAEPEAKSGNTLSGALMGRFNLLRSTPVKSILRSPQRLYSNDPAKVAAGTHLASPLSARGDKQRPLPPPPTAPASIAKRVDFTSSTKARYERAQSEADSTPTKGPTPPPKPEVETEPSPKAVFAANYPTLPTQDVGMRVTTQKRRQTAVPGDFTFTAHGNGIIFAQSPNAPASATRSSHPSTIRHVSADPQFPPPVAPATGSKKRKFDFENDQIVDPEVVDGFSDKENAGDVEVERPTKRMKATTEEPVAPPKVAAKRPTLGVKPKNGAKEAQGKKPTTISRARLNALAQPKRKA